MASGSSPLARTTSLSYGGELSARQNRRTLSTPILENSGLSSSDGPGRNQHFTSVEYPPGPFTKAILRDHENLDQFEYLSELQQELMNESHLLSATRHLPALSSKEFLAQSPMESSLIYLQLQPELFDMIATSVPQDAWEWMSTETDPPVPYALLSQEHDALKNDSLTHEELLTKDVRGCIVWNLLETEINYSSQLSIIQSVFRKRMQDGKIASETSINIIFAFLEELDTFHKLFCSELQDLVSKEKWSTAHTCIGKLFLHHKSELIRLYTKYIDNYALSQKMMKKEEKENPEYLKFMTEMAKLKDTNRQTLKDYLILPVQRTTRYHLLLKDLLKKTDASHPDYDDLNQAWDAMNTLAASVNEKKRREEEATGLFDTFEQTKYCPPTLISHKRRLILSADVTEFRSGKPARLVLCSDLLMITVPTRYGVLPFKLGNTEYPYRFVRWIDLLELEVFDLIGQGEAFKDVIKLTINPGRRRNLTRQSHTTPQPDIGGGSSAISKELCSSSIQFQFVGFEPHKTRISFVIAIESEMKSCREMELL